MTVLQFCGPMAFRVLQWCHPMLASSSRMSCCTRMITLYGTWKWIQAHAGGILKLKSQSDKISDNFHFQGGGEGGYSETVFQNRGIL